VYQFWSWTKPRLREVLGGTLSGSIAAVLFFLAGSAISASYQNVYKLLSSDVLQEPSHPINERWPLIVALLALLLLILPDFVDSSVRLLRSWSAGLVRGAIVAWAFVFFLFWIWPGHKILLISLGLFFQLATELLTVSHRRSSYTAEEIHRWVPERRIKRSQINFDKPVENWTEDAIGREGFVETVLGRVLVDGDPAVGITAGFGEGKSSVLNLIRISIENGNRAVAVPFQTWLPGSERTFVESLFDTATAAIRQRFFLVQWRSTLAMYGRVVSGVVPKSWSFLSSLLPPESQATQIEDIKRLFARLPVRVVLLLDEIDRMHEEELATLLKVLRGTPELPNISYVCAFSKDAVARVISPDNPQHGMRYLEKFFPVQLQLPRLDEDLLYYIISDEIGATVEREQMFMDEPSRRSFNDSFSGLWHQLLKRELTNFRIVGQTLRSFDSSLHALRSEVHAFDLLVIELVRLLLPDTYEFVYRSGQYFYDPPTRIERWVEAGFDDKEERDRKTTAAFDAHFDGLTPTDRSMALGLLARIFPAVKGYAQKKSKGLPPLLISEAGDLRRIHNPDFFPRYFTYSVPATLFGEAEMDLFLASIRTADEQTTKSRLESTYPPAQRDDLRRIDFVRRLEKRVAEIPVQQAQWLAESLADKTPLMLSTEIIYIRIQAFVLASAGKMQGTPVLQEFLLSLVQHAGSDYFASSVVHSSTTGRRRTEEITDWSGVSEERLKEAFTERMRRSHPTPYSEALKFSSDDVVTFMRWQIYAPSDESYITEFFRSAFDADRNNLAIFLQWLLPGNVGYEGSPIKLIDKFYPSAETKERLEKAEAEGVNWGPPHAAAVNRFREFLERYPPDSTVGAVLPGR
jgi:hypothetical protein